MTALRKLLIGSVFGFILSFGFIWQNEADASLKAVATQSLSSPGPIGGTTPAAGTFTTLTVTQLVQSSAAFTPLMDYGVSTAGLVTIKRTDAQNNYMGFGYDGSNASIVMASIGKLGWSASGTSYGSPDSTITRAAPNSLQFAGAATAAAAVTSRTEINKAVAGIADNVATATFTITIPNAAHSASILIVPTCSLGAGGAIGAGEATGTISYNVSIARTAGVAAVGTTSTGYGSASSLVAGAATITTTGALSAVSGAVGATNTFTFNVTVAHGSGSSTNHTCVMYARLMNANATGITIS